ncbi:hypothetical protein ARAM_007196 [Aspergillus rambellii]|uniref:Zn(2)-C6 fungal-type domain-containing protein n=1 Tax=Aspergillus rambellii TaxID=308745 RepID=A0A0F8WKU7_9EURO|nr:hypothetical protein ARAM_007196 [Aspergillus rambellii]
MPRPRRPGAPEPKRRSRKGCWSAIGEEKPSCLNCRRQNERCDYSIRLNWGGRTRRKTSVDSPGSQSSSRSGQFFTPSPPHLSGPNREITVPDQPTESLFWDAGFSGEMAMGTSYPRRLHDDIQDSPTVPDQSLKNSNRTTDRDSVDLAHLSQEQDATSWSALSARMTETLPREEPSHCPPASRALDNPPFPSPPAETSPSIPPLPDFNFSPGPVSHPISYVRPPLDAPQHVLHQAHFTRYSSSAEVGLASTSAGCEALSPSTSHGTLLSPCSNDAHLFSGGLPQDNAGTPDTFFTGIMESHATDFPPGLVDHNELSSPEKQWQTYLTSVTDNYGLDCGRPDVDLGKNDDHSAINVNDALSIARSPMGGHHDSSPGGQSGVGSKYEYYATPVAINIPCYLSPLPPSLLKTPINLMYFHHFLNHTARILVPHDCGDNPFSSVLPSMAIGDSNLLNLLLAYSASHRARHLGHSEPANRIALWVSNVFPSLRVALEDPHEKVTDNHLATAIMLLSLKIVSPSTFEVPIPWQSHLKLARDLYLARHSQMAYSGNRVGAFLTRWLGYLDILGSLSCRYHEPPLLTYYSVLDTCCADEERDEFAVDCFTGFTARTGLFLMQLGGLVHQCDNARFDEMGAFIPEWTPSPDVTRKADALLAQWDALGTHARAYEGNYERSECSDMIAVDRAFRYAGLLHLRRRVLGESSSSMAVKAALDGLVEAVTAIRPGAAAEVGVLFPIFTAGCEAQEFAQRIEIKERLEILEGTGMKQIQNARTLMQRCWDADVPWIALAQGEFLG